MADARDVARLFVLLENKSTDNPITNLKLNKLMYFAQGACLARTGTPLFDEPIEAWTYGPVVPSVYRAHKICGSGPIMYDGEKLSTENFTQEELDAILDVEREFGQYSGSRLVSLTHKSGTPWSIAFESEQKQIPNESIERYFTEHPVPLFHPSGEKVAAFPASWYDPDEDAEWEEYLE